MQRHWPGLEIAIEQIRTTGDRVTDRSLSQIGGDGVFITEIEHALREGRIDLAVHSLKDLPTAQPAGLAIIVTGPREDVRDAFVSNVPFQLSSHGLELLEADSNKNLAVPLRIGTCSLRRTAQIRALCPGAEILPIRGNVDTRLRKLEAGEYDGIVLAAAGLHRMNIQERLAERVIYFPVEDMMPAPGQGALAIEIRDEPETRELLYPVQDVETQAATSAERAFMRQLGAGCYLPVAAYGEIVGGEMTLQGLVTSLDGQRQVRVSEGMPWTEGATIEQAEQLGIRLAEQALRQGADEIIQAIAVTREAEREHV